jgi:hypothetical protein
MFRIRFRNVYMQLQSNIFLELLQKRIHQVWKLQMHTKKKKC